MIDRDKTSVNWCPGPAELDVDRDILEAAAPKMRHLFNMLVKGNLDSNALAGNITHGLNGQIDIDHIKCG